jgi:hypothetical protein
VNLVGEAGREFPRSNLAAQIFVAKRRQSSQPDNTAIDQGTKPALILNVAVFIKSGHGALFKKTSSRVNYAQ